jgi:ferredoxin-NADP reductase
MGTATAPPVFKTKLIGREEIANQTMAFRFEKIPGWTFTAGQAIDITLIDPPESDGEGNTRGLSLASAPFEDTILVATRLRNTAFKRVLKSAPLGTEVKVEGPFGNLTLHNNAARAAVFVSGGIGITPVRSILLSAAQKKLPHRIFLFFSNHTRQDAPFFDELDRLQARNPNYRFIPTMTDLTVSCSCWSGETGFINSEMLARHLHNVQQAIYYLTGPSSMVMGMRTVLHEAGVDDDDIRVEEFLGY